MRLIVANWKMHKTRAEAAAFAAELAQRIGDGIPGRELMENPGVAGADGETGQRRE